VRGEQLYLIKPEVLYRCCRLDSILRMGIACAFVDPGALGLPPHTPYDLASEDRHAKYRSKVRLLHPPVVRIRGMLKF
jgi:hypothetical protein